MKIFAVQKADIESSHPPTTSFTKNLEVEMVINRDFYLFDKAGLKSYASEIAGEFQIGKAKDETTASLSRFVSAIVKEGKAGRFESACGKRGTLVFSSRSKNAVGYVLDSKIAQFLALPTNGTK